MLSPEEQMHIIKTALKNGYKGPIYELIDQAIIEKNTQQQQQQQQQSTQSPEVSTPALGGRIPKAPPTTSTERNIIRPGQYRTGGFKTGGLQSEEGEKEETFKEAYKRNREAGNKTFLWEDAYYSTESESEKKSRLEEEEKKANPYRVTRDPSAHRYGTGDESHLIIYDPGKAGGHGFGAAGFSDHDRVHEYMQTMFNTGRFGYNPETGTLVKLKDPNIYDIDYGDGRYFSMVSKTEQDKKSRETISDEEYEKRESQWNKKQRYIAMGHSEEEAEIMSKLSDSELKQFHIDKQKRRLEDFYGVTDVKRLLKSKSSGEVLTNLTNTRLGNLAGILPNRIEFNPANIGRTTITANTMKEAFADAEASENIKYGDQFIWEKPDGTRERLYYEHAGKPNDEITLKILKRIEDQLTPEEYENFIKRYAGWNNPNIRIGVGDKGTQFAANIFGRDDKGTIHISEKDAKSVDNLIESIYSEGAHAEQQLHRGRASYEWKSLKGHIYDFFTGDDRYEREGSFEHHAHGGGPHEDLGYGGIEGRMMYEDFYATRGKYDHDKERFEKPIDRQYFLTEASKVYLRQITKQAQKSSQDNKADKHEKGGFKSKYETGGLIKSIKKDIATKSKEVSKEDLESYFEGVSVKKDKKDKEDKKDKKTERGEYPFSVRSEYQKKAHDLMMDKGMIFVSGSTGNRYFKHQKDADEFIKENSKNSYIRQGLLNEQGLVTLDQTRGNRVTFLEVDDPDYQDEIMSKINAGTHGYHPETKTLYKLTDVYGEGAKTGYEQYLRGIPKRYGNIFKDEKGTEFERFQLMGTSKYAEFEREHGTLGPFSSKAQDAELSNYFTNKEIELIKEDQYNRRRDIVAQNMQEVYQNPLWYAPGAIYLATTGYTSGALPFALNTLRTAGTTPLIGGISGTSAFDALTAYGLYHTAKHGPEDVRKFIDNPNLNTGFDVALHGLAPFGVGTTVKNVSTGVKQIKAASNISVPTRFTNVNLANQSLANNSKNITNINKSTSDIPYNKLNPTTGEYRLTNDGIEEAIKFKHTNFTAPENMEILNKYPKNQRDAILATYRQNTEAGNLPYIYDNTIAATNEIGKSKGTSGVFQTKIGDFTMHDVTPGAGTLPIKLLDDWTMPRYSRVGKIVRGNNIVSKESAALTTIHELDHTTNVPGFKSAENFAFVPGHGKNQLGVITREGIIDPASVGTDKLRYFQFNEKLDKFESIPIESSGKLSFFDRWNPFKSSKLKTLEGMKNRKVDMEKYDNYLEYYSGFSHDAAKGKEVGAKIQEVRLNFNIPVTQKLNSSTAKYIFNQMKTRNHKFRHFHSLFKDSEAFKNMMNNYTYGTIPAVIGAGLTGGDEKKAGGYRSRTYRTGGLDNGDKEPTTEVALCTPIYDSSGRFFSSCANRMYDDLHNVYLGTGYTLGKSGDDITGSAKLTAGYEFHPRGGTGNITGHIGGNIGTRMNVDDLKFMEDAHRNEEPTFDPFAQATASFGYEGDFEDAGSFKLYKQGRGGDPLKWGIGAYATKDFMGDKSTSLGAYTHLGQFTLTGGYNFQKGAEATIGFGFPFRKTGGLRCDSCD